MKPVSLVTLTGIVIFLCSCALHFPVSEEPKAAMQIQSQVQGLNDPITLKILHEDNDSQNLSVAGSLLWRRGFENLPVFLELNGLNAGDSLARDYLYFESKAAGRIREEPFLLQVAVSNLEEYQLALLWGEEAQSAMLNERRKHSMKLEDLEVVREQHTCKSLPCTATYSIYGKILNTGVTQINQVKIGVKLVLKPRNAEITSVSGEEEVVELSNLALGPGTSKSLKIAIDREVPFGTEAGEYQPSVRVIGFN